MKLREEHKMQILRKIQFRYLVLKVRSKLSFMAFMKKQTVSELLINQILKSYRAFIKVGLITRGIAQEMMDEEDVYQKLKTQSLS